MKVTSVVAPASAGVTSGVVAEVFSAAGSSMGASPFGVLGLLPQAPMDSGLLEREEEVLDCSGGFKLEIFGGVR